GGFMSYLANAKIGAIAPAANPPGVPWIVQVVLYVTLTVFYAANVYEHQLSDLLGIIKWLPLAVLLLLLCVAKNSRFSLQNILPITVFVFPLLVSVFVSDDITLSAAYFISVFAVILIGRLIALQWPEPHQFSALFKIMANIGRFVIVSSAVM